MDGARSKEPTRIANLRKRLHRIEQTKQRMKESGRPPDRRQVSALDQEAEVRGEICKWEQYGVLHGPLFFFFLNPSSSLRADLPKM